MMSDTTKVAVRLEPLAPIRATRQKTQATPDRELKLARKRLKEVQG